MPLKSMIYLIDLNQNYMFSLIINWEIINNIDIVFSSILFLK